MQDVLKDATLSTPAQTLWGGKKEKQLEDFKGIKAPQLECSARISDR